ncbi:hypothetical protein Ciccas_006865 [Cichlidogyrus casuarinus]|uniref:Uncharacterized protein n=1 Tax=Cichlidogyrus casuarinus TaxID=1844966 RepID=A0ABD2Q711_9PLAT
MSRPIMMVQQLLALSTILAVARVQAVEEFDCDMIELHQSLFNDHRSAQLDERRLDPIQAAERKRQKSIADDITCFDPSMPKRITVREGEPVSLPCIVSNVKFDEIKASLSYFFALR